MLRLIFNVVVISALISTYNISKSQRYDIKKWNLSREEVIGQLNKQGFELRERKENYVIFAKNGKKYKKRVQVIFESPNSIKALQTLKGPCKQETLIRKVKTEYGSPTKETHESYIWRNTNSILLIKKESNRKICETMTLNPKYASIE